MTWPGGNDDTLFTRSGAFWRVGHWLDRRRLGALAGATVGSVSGARWRDRARLVIVVIAIAAMPIRAAVV